MVVRASSPTFPTVGGPVGLSYVYNSQAPLGYGLTGSYFADPAASRSFDGKVPAMTRRDPTPNLYWGTEGPGGGMAATNYLVRWTGTITAPVSGDYKLRAINDDGIRISVDNNVVMDRWFDQSNTDGVDTSVFPLTAGAGVPIKIEYYQGAGPAWVSLWARGPIVAGSGPLVALPPSWLTSEAGPLPDRWTLAPGNLAYASAQVTDRSVSFIDTSGAAHNHRWEAGAFRPPAEQDSVVGMTGAGALTLHADDGLTYAFAPDGRISAASAATDDTATTGTSSAAACYVWSKDDPTAPAGASRLRAIYDPVGARFIKLSYFGQTQLTGIADNPCTENPPNNPDPISLPTCSTLPEAMLCKATYWDATTTEFTYTATGQLIRIVDPGGAVTDLGYDVDGQLVTIRNPLAADWVAVDAANRDNDNAKTVIDYEDDTSRVGSVTLPAPTPADAATRPAHTYTYPSDGTEVDVAGLTEPRGFARKAKFELGALESTVTEYDPTVPDTPAPPGPPLSTKTVYNSADRPVEATDLAGRRSTTFYDGDATRIHPTGRVTETYGPANTSCFGANRRPNGSCTAPPVAHTATEYDKTFPNATFTTGTAVTGLTATYWKSTDLAGAPKAHGGVVPPSDGTLIPADPPPASGLTARSWSGRYIGEIDASGPKAFGLTLTGWARLFVDDRLVVDAWSSHPVPTTLAGAPVTLSSGRHRIRIDYAAQSDYAATLRLLWGAPATGVPASVLAPRHSNPVKTSVDDTTTGVPTRVTTTTYNSMADGLVKSQVQDPGGLSLETKATYETPGIGKFMRPETRTLPAGTATETKTAYYASGESPLSSNCAGASPNQGGMAKSVTLPDPDGAGTTWSSRIEQTAYDAAGRVVASRRSSADNWICTTYDSRGRAATRTFPGPQPRTVTYNYAVGGDPLTNSVHDSSNVITTTTATITTKMDLLGRVVSYTDVWDQKTDSIYDQAGRLITTNGPQGRLDIGYDAAGRVEDVHLDDPLGLSGPIADPVYDPTTKELSSVSYAGGGGNGTSLNTIGRDSAGRTTRLLWNQAGGPATTMVDDQVTRSQTGRVTDETIDGTDAHAGSNNNFLYDAAGRLTQAWTPGHALSYAYAASVPSCALAPAAGKNTNRTSMVDNGTPTTYCYGADDRLASSSDTSVGNPVYDAHGNTTTLGSQTLSYDGGDRHMQSVVTGGATVGYVRDATDRIVARTEGSTTTRYGYMGPGDGAGFTMNSSNTVQDRFVSLPGGASVTKRKCSGPRAA